MPDLNDISLHQLVVQWERDLQVYKEMIEIKYPGPFDVRADELQDCITELKQVIGLLP